jgi:hypothetical protein
MMGLRRQFSKPKAIDAIVTSQAQNGCKKGEMTPFLDDSCKVYVRRGCQETMQ